VCLQTSYEQLNIEKCSLSGGYLSLLQKLGMIIINPRRHLGQSVALIEVEETRKLKKNTQTHRDTS
jgi:hypothetical protein